MPAVVYATQAELTDYLGLADLIAISDRDLSGEVDADAISAALADASSTADSYLAPWLPLAAVPLVLRRHTMAIATYSLANNAQTDDHRRRYEDAIAWLRDVAKGVVSLGIPPAEEDPSSAVGVVSYHTAARKLSRETLGGLL